MTHRASHKAMDTEFTVSIAYSSETERPFAESAAVAAFARIDAIERLLTRFDDTSDVAVIRALAPGETAAVARETMDALLLSAKVCAATNGAFDPTLGPVMDRLRGPRAPDSAPRAAWGRMAGEAGADAFARGGMQRLVLDVDHLLVSVTADRLGRATPLELDFGGVGKGYALDECAALLSSEPFCCDRFLLDAGTSTVLARGGAWEIGVGGAFKGRTRRGKSVALENGAVSGSGFDLQGEHIVDVRRRGAAARWAAAWAAAESAAVADALSTAALSLSPAELDKATRDLGASVMVARRQPQMMDRFRDPLAVFGEASVAHLWYNSTRP